MPEFIEPVDLRGPRLVSGWAIRSRLIFITQHPIIMALCSLRDLRLMDLRELAQRQTEETQEPGKRRRRARPSKRDGWS